jgi:hypothetical protein
MKISLSMAYAKKFAETKIVELSFPTAQHVMYLIFSPSNKSSKHWIGELSAIIQQGFAYTNLKNNKKLKRKIFHACFYGTIWIGHEEVMYGTLLNEVNYHLKSKFTTEREEAIPHINSFYELMEEYIYSVKVFDRTACEKFIHYWVNTLKGKT